MKKRVRLGKAVNLAALGKNAVAHEGTIDPPADRHGGGGKKDEEDGVAGAVASFVDDLAFAEIGIKTTLAAAIGEVIGRGHGGALALLLFEKFEGGGFDH